MAALRKSNWPDLSCLELDFNIKLFAEHPVFADVFQIKCYAFAHSLPLQNANQRRSHTVLKLECKDLALHLDAQLQDAFCSINFTDKLCLGLSQCDLGYKFTLPQGMCSIDRKAWPQLTLFCYEFWFLANHFQVQVNFTSSLLQPVISVAHFKARQT